MDVDFGFRVIAHRCLAAKLATVRSPPEIRNPKSEILSWYEGTKLDYLNRESYYLDLLYYRLCPVNTS